MYIYVYICIYIYIYIYMNVVVSHVYDSTRVMLCSGFLVVFRRVYTKPGKQKILLDRGWDSNPRPSYSRTMLYRLSYKVKLRTTC